MATRNRNLAMSEKYRRGGGAPGVLLANAKTPVASRAGLLIAAVTLWVSTEACTKPYGARSTGTPSPPQSLTPAASDDAAAMPLAPTSASVLPRDSGSETATPPETIGSGVRACTTEEGAKWIAAKGRHRLPGNAYPAIVQGDEYGPIEAIHTFYAQASGTTSVGQFEIEGQREVSTDASRIMITGPRGPVNVDLSEKQIRIGVRSFVDPKAISVFQALQRVLADLGAQCEYQGIRGSRLRTRAYKDVIRIEFGYGPVVVQLEAASNGRANPERLYALDVAESEDSFLWRSTQNPDP
jgi:hypothetical protein